MDSQSPLLGDRWLKSTLPLTEENRDALLSIIGGDNIQVPITIQVCHIDTVIPQAGRMILPRSKGSIPTVQKDRSKVLGPVGDDKIDITIPIKITGSQESPILTRFQDTVLRKASISFAQED